MKKILVPVLILAIVCAALCGCTIGSRRYKLQAIPDELTIEPAALSEDTENLLRIDETYPLLAALPEEDLYVYSIDPTITHGALVKFDGVIQYFSWLFEPVNANPELYACDYDADGRKDVAITFRTAAGQKRYNEELHVLMRTEDGFKDCMYSTQRAVQDAEAHMTLLENPKGIYNYYVDGVKNAVKLNGGTLLGLYFDDMQDYTLGETITLKMNPGVVFAEKEIPDYSQFTYMADISLETGICTQVNVRVELK